MSDVSITAGGPPSKRITGRELASWSSKASLLTRLAVGAAWSAGEIDVDDLTISQIARVLGVKSKQVKALAGLKPDQRAALTNPRQLNGRTNR
jgi:hypothetical protein